MGWGLWGSLQQQTCKIFAAGLQQQTCKIFAAAGTTKKFFQWGFQNDYLLGFLLIQHVVVGGGGLPMGPINGRGLAETRSK